MREKVLKAAFELGMKGAQIHRQHQNVSLSTVRRWIREERYSRQKGRPEYNTSKRGPGRPRSFTESELRLMKLEALRLSELGHQITPLALLQSIGREDVNPKRIYNYKDQLMLSWKRPQPKPRTTRSLSKTKVAAMFLEEVRKLGAICHLHFFDEKPLCPNAVPGRTLGPRGKEHVIEKEKDNKTHFSQLTLCNSVYGFKILDVLQHKSGVFFFFNSTTQQHYLTSSPGEGTKRVDFVEQCKKLILPVLIEARQRSMKAPGNKKPREAKLQHLFLDRAKIHVDNKNDSIAEVFRGVAKVHYIPSVAHEILNPLDFSLFAKQQKEYAKVRANSLSRDVPQAARAAAATITTKNVHDALCGIGYYMRWKSRN